MDFDNSGLPAPKKTIRQTDHRSVRQVIMEPHRQFYAPDDLDYGNAQLPVVPGNGGYISIGANVVLYEDNNTWNRGDLSLAGPVRDFFRRMMQGQNKVKQT